MLGSGLSSRLYRNLREAEGLAYQLGSSYSPKMLGGIFMTYIGTNPDSCKSSISKCTNGKQKSIKGFKFYKRSLKV